MVTEMMEAQKNTSCAMDYYLLLTGWPLMGDPAGVLERRKKWSSRFLRPF
jgi:hypothetical protein